MLPQRLRLGPEREWVEEVLPRFAEYSADAESLWHEFDRGLNVDDDGDDEAEPMAVSEKCRICAAALNINYRVREEELSALGLLTTMNIEYVLAAIIDVKSLQEMMEDHLAQQHGPAQLGDIKKNGERGSGG